MSEPAGAVVVVRDAEKSFDDGRIRALNSMNLTVYEGEWVAIIGPSGCGKSTLLHLIAALDLPNAGHIHVLGSDLDRLPDAAAYRRLTMGMVFQLHNLLPSLTAVENVEVPMFGTGVGRRERRRRALRLLDLVGLPDRADARPTELSGGQRQRVAIARALANDPPLLLADEPTGSLDSDASRRVLDLIGDIRRQRKLTTLMVTHDPAVAARADRIVEMLDGHLAGPAQRPEPGVRAQANGSGAPRSPIATPAGDSRD
jgi:putative ABC transport system ATP-binding protein